jgi:hypothetical protein
MEVLIFAVIVFAVFLISKMSQPSPRIMLERSADPKGFYQHMTIGQVGAYQAVFNKIIAVIKEKYVIDTLSDEQKGKIANIINQAQEEQKLNVDYFLVMVHQYLFADEIEREIYSDQWVQIVTNMIDTSGGSGRDFYPSAWPVYMELMKSRAETTS